MKKVYTVTSFKTGSNVHVYLNNVFPGNFYSIISTRSALSVPYFLFEGTNGGLKSNIPHFQKINSFFLQQCCLLSWTLDLVMLILLRSIAYYHAVPPRGLHASIFL